MRRISATIAIMGFFTLAGFGMVRGVGPLQCGIRAIIGAGAIYVMVSLAGHVVIRIIADAAARAIAQKNQTSGEKR